MRRAQYDSYDTSCELARVVELWAACEGLSLVMIRYNPDAYSADGKQQNPGAAKREAALAKAVPPRVYRNHRHPADRAVPVLQSSGRRSWKQGSRLPCSGTRTLDNSTRTDAVLNLSPASRYSQDGSRQVEV